MKKLYSLIKACMTTDMNIFKIKQKKDNKKSNIILPIVLSMCFFMTIFSYADDMLKRMIPLHLESLVLSTFILGITIFIIVEGIYKTSSLIFNCKDDQLLLSLPIKRSTIIFIRIFKFYVFELMFNSLLLLPLIVAYIKWVKNLNWTFFLTNIIMLFTLPIIPIIISCIIGTLIAITSSKFKYKNLVQILVSIVFILGIFYLSFNTENIINYLIKHSTSINDLITKIYYPAGVYVNLISNFNIIDLLIYLIINTILFSITIFIISKIYFKINSQLKNITTNKVKLTNLKIEAKSINMSLIKKELNTFFKTPVFIINAGFGLVLFIFAAIIIKYKFNSIIPLLTDKNGINISKEVIMNNLSIFILILISSTAYMTSITNSVISLEGRNINILKTLPIKSKTILMSKVYSALFITTPVLFIGDIILFIEFKVSIIESILILILSILIPLVSHFIGIIINLRYPKLEFENSAEVVKQSISSFLSVMIGMFLLFLSVYIVIEIIGKISSIIILIVTVIIYLIIDGILYLYLIKKGTKEFENLSTN